LLNRVSGKGKPKRAKVGTIDGMLSLDSTTFSEYDGAETPTAQIAAVLSALADPVTVRVYDGSNAVMGTGTMATPWATQDGSQLRLGALSSFTVGTSGTPNSGWYIRFESGSRWLRGAFGLKGSPDVDFTWNLSTWQAGQTAIIGTATVSVIAAPTNNAPQWSGAPTSLSLAADATYNFAQHASDPDGDTLSFSKVGGAGTGTVSPAGVYTMGTPETVQIRAWDGALGTVHQCTTAYPVADTSARVVYTNFGPGLSFVSNGNWITGAYYRIEGTDGSTGQLFNNTTPTLYGRGDEATVFHFISGATNHVSSDWPAGPVTEINNRKFVHRFEQVTGPSGQTQWALYSHRKTAFQFPDQILWMFFPDWQNVTQGMFYFRFWRRYPAGFFNAQTQSNEDLNTLVGSKTINWNGRNPGADRTQLQTARTATSGIMFNDSEVGTQYSGDNFRGSTFSSWTRHNVRNISHTFPENTWFKVECAFRQSTTSGGWFWCAIDGVEKAFYQGQTHPDIRRSQANRVYPVSFYLAGTQSNDLRVAQWTTGFEAWTAWPNDAAPHPNVS
jgi:hypothetical protein